MRSKGGRLWPPEAGKTFFFIGLFMSYPDRQDGTRKKEVTNGNIDALPILRGRHEPGGLGSHRGVLCPLRGNHGGNPQPGDGRIGVFASPAGTGAGLETGHESCVVLWAWWQPLSGPASRGFVWGVPGRCRSYPFSLPFQPHFGGR